MINIQATLAQYSIAVTKYTTIEVVEENDFYIRLDLDNGKLTLAVDIDVANVIEFDEGQVRDMQLDYLQSTPSEREALLKRPGVQEMVSAITADQVHDLWLQYVRGDIDLPKSIIDSIFMLFLELTKYMKPAKFFLAYGDADLHDWLDQVKHAEYL